MTILENIPLAPLTTLKVGGPARYFAPATTDDEVREAVQFARTKNLPLLVLGGGSNVLIPDDGFSGVVLHMKSEDVALEEEGESVRVIADAGVAWDSFVAMCVSRELFGLENLSGIPGSVGASVVQNIGAYGVEVCESIEWIEVYDRATDLVRRIVANDAQFGYRESIFKHDAGKQLIVLRVAFLLLQKGTLSLGYKDLESYTQDIKPIVSLADMREAVLAIRGRKFPNLETFGTAGSFFKNPIVEAPLASDFLMHYPNAPHYPLRDGKVKLSAAWIIDNILHMRGMREGSVGTWSKQALVLINYGGATTTEIKNFAAQIQTRAMSEARIALLPEVVFVENKR